MEKITVTLRQHTPLLHFQHSQEGATLRASEVKPKLDRYILTKLGGGDYEKGVEKARGKQWLVVNDNNDCKALNYKMRIKSIGDPVKVQIWQNAPLILSNMGVTNSDEKIDFSFYQNVQLEIRSVYSDLLDELFDKIDCFFALHNFGQRQDKGFGSFTVQMLDGNKVEFENGLFHQNTFYFKITNIDRDIQRRIERLFGVIDFYWKSLKSGINATRNGQYENRYIKSYLWNYLNGKGLTWEKRQVKQTFDLTTNRDVAENNNKPIFARALLGCPELFEYKNFQKKVTIDCSAKKDENNYVARIPSPIIFKPVFVGNECRVYLLYDEMVVSKLRDVGDIEFQFECGNKTLKMTTNVNKIDYAELLKGYHQYLKNTVNPLTFNGNDVVQQYEDYKEENDVDGKLFFIPVDFAWKRIVREPVVIYVIK